MYNRKFRAMELSQRVVAGLLASGLVVSIWAEIRIEDLKKRKIELEQMKLDCSVKPDPQKKECLDIRQEKVDQYKVDVEAYKAELKKSSSQLDNQDYKSAIENRQKNIQSFEDYLKGCTEKSELCGSALIQVASLTFQNEEDEFLLKQEKFEKDYQRWEDRDHSGTEPVSPRRNHSVSMRLYQSFIKDYPNNKAVPDVLARTSFVADMQGKGDLAFEYLNQLVKGWPNHSQAAKAHLRMGEYWFLKHEYSKAIEQYSVVPLDYPGPEAGLALYHRAEAYYNMASFEEAAKWFFEFVKLADAGKIQGADLRDEAMNFLAASWADMDNGFETASRFLSAHGNPVWRSEIYFQIGLKNISHDRLDEAIKAFRFLLDKDPTYSKAPTADLKIVEILILQKKPEDAQLARMKLAQRYADGSEWFRRNSENKPATEEARKAVHLALYQIPVYYHLKSESGDSDQVLLLKAEEGYRNYLNRFPNEISWDVYQVHQHLAVLYTKLGKKQNAAVEWKWCATFDSEKLGKPPSDKKNLVSKQDAGYNSVLLMDEARKEALKGVYNNDTGAAFKGSEAKAYLEYAYWFAELYGSSPAVADIAYNTAILNYEAKRYDEAIKPLSELIARFPDHNRAILIRRALAQCLLEIGKYDEAANQFGILQAKLCPGDSQCSGIKKATASTMFKQAEILQKGHDYSAASKKFQHLAKEYRDVEFADKALFEAGVNADSAGNSDEGARLLLRISQEYPKSGLRIKASLRAASIYMKATKYRDAADVFLRLQRDFPSDSMAGIHAIGWAADAYQKAGNDRQTGQIYEMAFRLYPTHEKTPGYLYNAGQIYENAKWYGDAIAIYRMIFQNFPSSQYALEAMFSVPLLFEKQGDKAKAAQGYNEFASKYSSDKVKLMQAYLSAGKLYEGLGDERLALDNYSKCVSFQPGSDLPPALASEAAYRAGDIFFRKVAAIRLDGTKSQNAGRFKGMLSNLTPAIQNYAKAVEFAEEEWALRATLKIGDLFSTIAGISDNQRVAGLSGEDRFRVSIDNKRTVPQYLDKAMEVYKKNLEIGLSQNLSNTWIDTAGIRYMESFLNKGKALEELGELYLQIPLPSDAPAEELEEARAQLKGAADEQKNLAVETYREALNQAQIYFLNNLSRNQILSRLGEISPDAPEIQLQVPPKPAASPKSNIPDATAE